MTARKQASTRSVSTRSIVASREFARGLDEVRKGPRSIRTMTAGTTRGVVPSASLRRSTCRCGSAPD